MSRWAALFADLSAKDTIDTIDKIPSAGGGGVDCVDCVNCVPRGTGEIEVAHRAPPDPDPPAEWWLADIARSITEAVAAGADRDADQEGFLVLVRPEGERLVVTPGTVAALDAAGLLPPLPPAMERSRHAATARPPCWSDPADLPVKGDRCRCGGRRWWTYSPKPDGWCCAACRPPMHLRPETVRAVVT
jgi:hypothetical protein